MILAPTGGIQIRRWRGGLATLLGQVASGLGNLSAALSSFTFTAQGAGPVSLTVALNGVLRLQVEDSSAQAIAGAGGAGMTAQIAGVIFDDFVLSGASATPPPPPPPPPSSGVLFSDDFQRTATVTLGPDWRATQGVWFPNGSYGVSGLNTGNRAVVGGMTCADCHIDCKLETFGVEGGLVLREQSNGDRYDMILAPTGAIQIRRWRGGVATLLGQVASGIGNLSAALSSFTFTAQGAGPVSLTVALNGVLKLQVQDSSTQAIAAAGGAGMTAVIAGVIFDDFVLATP
jgi:hypothetical protein